MAAPTQRAIPEGATVAFLTPTHSWVMGKIVAFDLKTKLYTCAATEPEKIQADKLKLDDLWHARAEYLDEDVNDLLQLTELHEASLLFCLKKRYLRDVVYTNIGPIVVALNPFNYEIPWYKDDVMPQYLAEGIEIERNLPHSWATAHNTYWEMRENNQHQTILISGESGAGKTEAAKIVVKYLGALSTLHGTPQQQAACLSVNTKLIAASPILESFGNAKTVRNDNSSRFGKFMKIQFDRDGFLIGSFATKYLLEKSRIISAAKDERVYHAFYQLAVGEDAKHYGLRGAKLYRMLSSGDCISIPGVDDAADFVLTKKAMHQVGISEEDQKAIWRVVAGILFCLNIDFVEKEERSGKVTTIDELAGGFVSRVAELWDVVEEDLEREVLQTTITARGESTQKPHSKAQATDTRDTVCKSLYDWLFDWLIDNINAKSDAGDRTDRWIGLLDIFGFEDFDKNLFEQVCINLANETLQNHYNNHIFTEDMKECKEEGIDTSSVSFIENKGCIELLTGKLGIFALLDEECKVNGSELNFLQKITANFSGTKQKEGNPFFLPVGGKQKDNCFRIRHYAGDVTYCVEQILEKNRDTLKDAMKMVLMKSKVPLIASLIPPPNDTGRPASKFTVGGYFVKQLLELMSLIHTTNPHWIRCIKPHPARKPRMFSHLNTMQQLRSAGVLDTVKVRKAGYPIRFKKDLFVQRYRILTLTGDDPALKSKDTTEICRAIFKKIHITTEIGQLGKTKIFLRQDAFTKLNHAKDEATEIFAHMFQSIGRASIVGSPQGISRRELFGVYVQVHRAKIIAERKAKEEALRRQREEEERQRRAEEEERQRRERLQKEVRHRSATAIQRRVRGMQARAAVFRYFMERDRARAESAMDAECSMYRDAWDEVEKHVSSLERREHEKRERTWTNDLEERVRFRHPEYLAERREANAKRLEEAAEKRRKQQEREELAAKNRAREALTMRKRQKEVAAAQAAEVRRQQTKLRMAHRDKTALAEQAAALNVARQTQDDERRRQEVEERFMQQMAEMRQQTRHDPNVHIAFETVKAEWKRNEQWDNEREMRYTADRKIAEERRREDELRMSLVRSRQYRYVPNLAFTPIPAYPRVAAATQLSPQEAAAERAYREQILNDASRTVRTIEILRRHAMQ